MASISSPEGYSQYMRNVSEIEDDYNRSLKKHKEGSERELEFVRERSKENLDEFKAESDETLTKTKDSLNEELSSTREEAKADVARAKADNYDKFGRTGGNQVDMATQQNKELRALLEDTKAENSRRIKELDQTYGDKLAARAAVQAAELEAVADTTRHGANESFRNSRMAEKAGDSEFREQQKKEYKNLEGRLQEERSDARKLTNHALDELTTGYEHRLRKSQRKEDVRNEDRETIHNDKLAELQRRLNEEHHRDTADLKRTVALDDEEKKKTLKDRIQSISDNIRDNENEWLVRKDQIQSANDSYVKKLKGELQDAELREAEKSSLALHDKEKKYGEIIRNQAQEARQSEKNLRENFDVGRKQMEMTMRRNQELQNKAASNNLTKAYESRDASLRNQAQTFNRAFENQKISYSDQIKHLQDNLHEARTSSDPNDVSPAVEESVRKSVIKEYEKSRLASEDRNKRAVDHMRQEYTGKIADVVRAKDTNTTQLMQTAAGDLARDREELLTHIEEVEHSKRQTIQDRDNSHEAQIERLSRKYMDIMANQRRSYEEMIYNLKNESSHRGSLERQDLSFKQKLSARDANTKHKELSHDFERKMGEQRFQFEAQMSELKAGHDQLMRDTARQNKHDIEELTKGYEQRIAQLEHQGKEKERYLTQNFQDELDKVRRANALLVQKKS